MSSLVAAAGPPPPAMASGLGMPPPPRPAARPSTGSAELRPGEEGGVSKTLTKTLKEAEVLGGTDL